ncbi:terpenoid synthase [Xylona heveae TC161]|uniref:Terpenoid synthase n=1 Tax=Xylona heveae (strain CBS 132557 / TC161) TaxID=1328760 RepID=A0A165HJS6_XYLHT|nr:terpenoid synthase [Xylona heveae TC161]KZF23620.1 terpenoid synthase [Xylona heveae TC161]
MVSENLRSPNAIPPRTSSNGLGNGTTIAAKPVLRPVSEADWISQGKRLHPTSPHATSPTTASPAAQGPAKLSPGREPPTSFGDDLIYSSRPSWSNEKEKILVGPFDYLFGHPGKDVRSHLIAAFNAWLRVPDESLEVITKVVGMLHTASLLVDDVEDSSQLRRGIPVAHSIFGTAQTINSANYVYFCALRELQKLKSPRAIDIFTEELLNLHRGQGMDLFWRDTLTCPSEEDYLEMVANKTGGLFRLAVKLMQAESDSSKDCVPLVNTIGLLFQIRDDYLNLSSTAYTQNKGLCEDLTEGKFSFPIIHSIRSDLENLQLLNILKQRTQDDQVKRYAVSYMQSTGTFAYCRAVLAELTTKANNLVDALDQGEGLGASIKAIVDKMAVD